MTANELKGLCQCYGGGGDGLVFEFPDNEESFTYKDFSTGIEWKYKDTKNKNDKGQRIFQYSWT